MRVELISHFFGMEADGCTYDSGDLHSVGGRGRWLTDLPRRHEGHEELELGRFSSFTEL